MHFVFVLPNFSVISHVGKKALMNVIKRIVKHRKAHPPEHGEELLLDLVLDYSEDEELQLCDSLTFAVGGFHTTGNCKCSFFSSGTMS